MSDEKFPTSKANDRQVRGMSGPCSSKRSPRVRKDRIEAPPTKYVDFHLGRDVGQARAQIHMNSLQDIALHSNRVPMLKHNGL